MSTHENSACDRAALVRDYAFDELAETERRAMEQHLTQCQDCAAELDQVRLTTAALRVLPEQEVPRRIAFVSDKIFERGFLSGIWNSAARLGFVSACVLAVGLSYAAYHRPAEARPVLQATEISKAAIDEAVSRAVALAVDKAHAEDVRLTQAALDAVDSKYAQKQTSLMLAMQDYMDVQSRRTQKLVLSSYGAGQ